ncbi:hypothetical protein Tco_1384975 [Tanacetum coccineum]
MLPLAMYVPEPGRGSSIPINLFTAFALTSQTIEDPAALVINIKAVDSFLQKFHALEKDVQKLKQADHSATILESIKSQSHTEGLKKELNVKKAEYKEFIEESVTNEVKNQLSKILPKAVSDFATSGIQITIKETLEQTLVGKDMKKRRTGKEAESSKKSSTPKESTKGKPLSKSSKTGKFAPTDQSVKEPELEVQMDFEEPTFENVANDADVPHIDPKPRILKLDWFTQPPRPETPKPDWNTIKTIDDASE